MIGVVGWAVVVGLVLAWEGLSIAVNARGWPSSSDMLRTATRPVFGRWLLFGAWLWLGWHVFMSGWTFFLAGPGASTPARTSKSAAQLFTHVVLPLAVCYLAFLALLSAAHRDSPGGVVRAGSGPARPTVRQRLRRIVVTVGGGYLVFAGVVGIYAAVSGELRTDLVSSAVREGGFLAFAVVLPAFVLVAVAEAVWRSHHGPGVPRTRS